MESDDSYFIKNNKIYMIIIAVLIMVILLYKHVIIAVIASSMYVVLIVYNVKNIKRRRNKWKKFIEDFSSKLDKATQSTIVQMPFPLVVIKSDGQVLWYNDKFSKAVDGRNMLEANIGNFIKEFKLKQLDNNLVLKQVELDNRYYDIYSNSVNSSENCDDKIILLYFYDVTELVYTLKSIDQKKPAAMLIEIDNLDDVLKTVDENEKPLIIAEVERTINIYAHQLKAMMRKYESNKYILTVENKYINDEMKKKFDILDVVRNIKLGNSIPMTLSIGIGRDGKSPLENEDYSVSAKELALSRGGDQAVVKSGEKFLFYGGKTKEVEKRTKVKARVITHALVGIIKESENVFIIGHKKPDIDCLGSGIGICNIVRSLKKECHIVLDDVNSSIKPIFNKIKQDSDYKDTFVHGRNCVEDIRENSLLIIVDVHSKSYVQDMKLVEKFDRIVIIDHHRKALDFIDQNLLSYIEPYASSTSEMVTEMFPYVEGNPKLKVIEAEALLAGICVDTKNFYFKTGVRTFEAASFLRKAGADMIDIKKFFSYDLKMYLDRAEIIRSAQIYNNIAIAVCPDNIEDTVLAAQAADELLNITMISASFVIVKVKNEAFISGRSLGDVNVQVILESLGGGGHMTIAGARIKCSDINDVLEKLRTAIDNYIEEVAK